MLMSDAEFDERRRTIPTPNYKPAYSKAGELWSAMILEEQLESRTKTVVLDRRTQLGMEERGEEQYLNKRLWSMKDKNRKKFVSDKRNEHGHGGGGKWGGPGHKDKKDGNNGKPYPAIPRVPDARPAPPPPPRGRASLLAFGLGLGMKKKADEMDKKDEEIVLTCSKCSGRGHTSSRCPVHTKCYKCQQMGHTVRFCPKNKEEEEEENKKMSTSSTSDQQQVDQPNKMKKGKKHIPSNPFATQVLNNLISDYKTNLCMEKVEGIDID